MTERDFFAVCGKMLSVAKSILGDCSSAEEAVQDTWLAWIRAPRSKIRNDQAWLFRVLKNKCRDAIKSRKQLAVARHEPAGEGGEDERLGPAECVQREELARRLRRAVDSLEEPYRQVIELRFFQRLSTHEIAARLGVPYATARTWLHRAQDQLKGKLGKDFPELGSGLPLLPLLLLLRGGEGRGPAPRPILRWGSPSAWVAAAAMAAGVLLAAFLVPRFLQGGSETSQEEAVPRSALAAQDPQGAPASLAALDASERDQGRRRRAARERELVMESTGVSKLVEVPLSGAVVLGEAGRIQRVGAPLTLRARAFALDAPDDPLYEGRVRTEADGAFALSLPSFEETVVVQIDAVADGDEDLAEGGSPGLEVVQPPDAPAPPPQLLSVFPVDCTVRGEIRDPAGMPVAGASVRLHGRVVKSDPQGGYRMPASSFRAVNTLVVHAPGFAVASRSLGAFEPGVEQPEDFQLAAERRIEGAVVDEAEQPIAGARVGLASSFGCGYETRTDATGDFELGLLDPQSLPVLYVQAQGYVPQVHLVFEEPVRIQLVRALPYAGSVVDEDGEAVVGARLAFLDPAPSTVVASEVFSGADGSFAGFAGPSRFEGGIRRPARVLVERPGLAPRLLELDPNDAPLSIVLREGRTVAGTVVEDRSGRPVERALVTVEVAGVTLTAKTYSDQDGAFRLEDLPGEHVLLWVCAPGRIGRCVDPSELDEGAVRLPRAGRLTGRVVDSSGLPIPQFTVYLRNPSLPSASTGSVDVDATWSRDGYAFSGPTGFWSTDAGVLPLVEGLVVDIEIRAEGYEPQVIRRQVSALDPEPIVTELVPILDSEASSSPPR